MKRAIYVVTTALSLGCVFVVSAVQQPVVAYKKVSNSEDKNKEWVIGIYSPQNKLIPGSKNITFKNNTKFLSGKGKNLFFDFAQGENTIYVYKGNESAAQKAIDAGPNAAGLLISKPLTQDDAPAGSAITITDSGIIIEKPKETTRTVTLYTIDEVDNSVPLTLQAAKIDNINASGADLYGKPVTINKYSTSKTYKLTIPKEGGFYIIRTPSQGQATTVEIPAKNSSGMPTLGKDTELAVGYNIAAKQKSARKQMVQDKAQIVIKLEKDCRDATSQDSCVGDWTVEIYDENERYTGQKVVLRQKATTIRVPLKRFWVYVTRHKSEGAIKTEINRLSTLNKDDVLKIDYQGTATITYTGGNAGFNTLNQQPQVRPSADSDIARGRQQYGGF